ncbi:MAG: hypothetical protein KIS84_04195 [Dokdonella sp.]|nr:hypothetical protein [Dokdonella sp.]
MNGIHRRTAHALLAGLALAGTGAIAQGDLTMPKGYAITQQRAAVEKSERVMAEAQKRPGLVAQYLHMRDAYTSDASVPFRLIFNQYLSWYQTWIGDYVAARDAFSIAQPSAADDAPSPLGNDYTASSASEAIAELAKGRQAVFFNENHSHALTRTLTVRMLATLRAEGFDTFAAETLYDDDVEGALATRGYPVAGTGFYTEEPIYAEMVREALRLGYRIVAYEALSDATGDAREAEQARNLHRKVFKSHPDARLVLNAGYAHIQESGRYFSGVAMAQHFRRLTGIDPLTIEQTMMVPHDKPASDHPYYTAIIAAQSPTEPIVFRDRSGRPWSLKRDAYDLSVVFPQETRRRGRPTWASIGGLRQPYLVTGSFCGDTYPCLVEARYENEGDDAIPADRVFIEWMGRHSVASDIVRESNDNIR